MGYTYDEAPQENRWLILGDKEQEFPTEPLTVESIEERKTAAGKSMPVMTLVNAETGDKYLICAWKRDVKACIDEYGTNTDQWDTVRFERKNGRIVLVPAQRVVVEESVTNSADGVYVAQAGGFQKLGTVRK